MNKTNNSKLTPNSKTLRKNMTKEERHLWYDFLNFLPVTVHRHNYFNNIGIKVLRYSNLDVNKNFSGVCKDILKHISSMPSPLIGGEGGPLAVDEV